MFVRLGPLTWSWKLWCLFIGVAACGEARDAVRPAVRDSAGITIVENRQPVWTEGDAWLVDSVPEFTIGVVEGAPEQQLFRVRGALRLEDGRIVIANGGSNEIRFYNASGRYLFAVGGEGEGPGEFRDLTGLFRYGSDSLLVHDSRLRRVSFLSTAGEFGRSFVLGDVDEQPLGSATTRLVGLFGDGSALGNTYRGLRPWTRGEGLIRDSSIVFRMSPVGDPDTLGVFPAATYFIMRDGRSVGNAPFTEFLILAAGSNHYHRTGDRHYEIGTYGLDGSLARVVRIDRPPRAITREHVERYSRERLERATSERVRQRRERELAEVPIPEVLPAYVGAKVDAEGSLWASVYQPFPEEPDVWMVFDVEGRWLGEVRMPVGLVVYEIGADYVLARRTDDLDVEHVELYRLRKRANGTGTMLR